MDGFEFKYSGVGECILKQGRLPKSRVSGVMRVMKKMQVMKKDASDEKRCE